jgi:hypothetical protein
LVPTARGSRTRLKQPDSLIPDQSTPASGTSDLCWVRRTKISNVLAALPKSAQPGAKKALAEIWNAEDESHARDAVKEFESTYGVKFPKAADDVEQLLAFYDFPAEHWIHLRTTNPIVIYFRHRAEPEQDHKGPGSRAAGIAMAYKLIPSAARCACHGSLRASSIVRGRPAPAPAGGDGAGRLTRRTRRR